MVYKKWTQKDYDTWDRQVEYDNRPDYGHGRPRNVVYPAKNTYSDRKRQRRHFEEKEGIKEYRNRRARYEKLEDERRRVELQEAKFRYKQTRDRLHDKRKQEEWEYRRTRDDIRDDREIREAHMKDVEFEKRMGEYEGGMRQARAEERRLKRQQIKELANIGMLNAKIMKEKFRRLSNATKNINTDPMKKLNALNLGRDLSDKNFNVNVKMPNMKMVNPKLGLNTNGYFKDTINNRSYNRLMKKNTNSIYNKKNKKGLYKNKKKYNKTRGVRRYGKKKKYRKRYS